ncbi:MAG: diacylglycerol kinase family protein [Candidatus Omnitrophica bacterium]|nr:diacylglycerol kinase family protein [Candidatus Omnitrophota bacterium]
MENKYKNWILGRIRSFVFSFAGLKDMLKTQHNAWIHGAMTVLVLLVAWWLGLDPVKFGLIVLAIVGVWVAEAFNTVSEVVADIVSPRYSLGAKRAKDIAAGAVLIAAMGSVLIGITVLGPPLYQRFLEMLRP